MAASDHELRRAYEELARRVAEERLAFADRVQEVLEQAQHLQRELDLREEELARVEADAAALRARIEELDAEVARVVDSRSFRYTGPLRRLREALRR